MSDNLTYWIKTAVCIAIVAAPAIMYINTQLDSITEHSFTIGCMDSDKLSITTCSFLAKQYMKGNL